MVHSGSDKLSPSDISDVDLEAAVARIRVHRATSSTTRNATGREPSTSLGLRAGAATPPSFFNWAKTFTCTPAAIFYPASEQDVRCLVELARRTGHKLRPYGAGHSPSDLACVQSTDWLMQMDGLNELIEVDTKKSIVTVQGGIRLRDLHPILRQHGLALSSLGSISDQSIAGAIATATHGSSLHYGNLSSCVRALTIVTAQPGAPIISCKPSKSENADADAHTDDLFEASKCALGLTGVITRVSMQCEKAFNLQEEAFSMRTDAFISAMRDGAKDGIANSAQHVRAWWHPQAGEIRVSRMNRITASALAANTPTYSWLARCARRIKGWIRDRLIGYHWHQIGLLIGRVFPSFLTMHARFMYAATARPGSFLDTTPLLDLQNKGNALLFDADVDEEEKESSGTARPADPAWPRCSATTTRSGESVSIFNYDCLFPQYTYEGVVPLDRTAACLQEMKDWLEGELKRTGGLRHHFPIEIRFSPSDDVWMSPTYQMDGCYIGIVQYKPYGLPVTYRMLFDRFEHILFKYGGKPHWAKSHTAGPETLHRMFPRLADFLRVRSIVDPEGVFLNPYARRHFLGDKDPQLAAQKFKSSGQRLDEIALLQ